MKKIGKDLRLKLITRNKTVLAKRRRRNKRKSKSKKISSKSYYSHIVKAPQIFSIGSIDYRSALIEFLKSLRSTYNKKGLFLIDLSPTKKMVVDGTLLFKAELCRLLKRQKKYNLDKNYRIKLPHDMRIKEVLTQTGILKLLGKNPSHKPTFPDVVHWKAASGTDASGEKYDDVLGHYEGMVEETMLTSFFVGITEAMTNTTQHAYLEPRNDDIEDKEKEQGWWMFSQYKDGVLSVAFCDLGIGIPRSLPITRRPLMRFINPEKDSDYIEKAIEDSTSRMRNKKTGQGHERGKGLGQIANTMVDKFRDSSVIIYSNKGMYMKKHGERPTTYNFKDSIMGTMICWNVPVSIEEQNST